MWEKKTWYTVSYTESLMMSIICCLNVIIKGDADEFTYEHLLDLVKDLHGCVDIKVLEELSQYKAPEKPQEDNEEDED